MTVSNNVEFCLVPALSALANHRIAPDNIPAELEPLSDELFQMIRHASPPQRAVGSLAQQPPLAVASKQLGSTGAALCWGRPDYIGPEKLLQVTMSDRRATATTWQPLLRGPAAFELPSDAGYSGFSPLYVSCATGEAAGA
jgi:hypothetical protein